MGESDYGQLQPQDTTHDTNVLDFMIRQALAQVSTMIPVKVVRVHGNGDVAKPGRVDVQPLVKLVDGNGNASDPGVINGLTWFRLGNKKWGVICDPQVDDVGFVVVAQRDISSVVANDGAMSTPGSSRRFRLSDGIYLGGILMAAPDAYLLLKEDGHFKLSDVDGNVLETSSSGFALTGNVAVTGNITATGTITAGQGGVDQVGLQTHQHPTAALGSPSAPTPGT